REMHRGGDTLDGVHERQVQLGLEVVAPARPRARPSAATAAAEEPAEQVADIADVAHVEREVAALSAAAEAAVATGPHRAEAADLVVLLALGGVAEDVPRAGNVLELLLVADRVRVMLLRQAAVGGLDLLVARALGNPQRLVVVLLEPL